MNKEDIIRQFGEAKYQAALESLKKNDFETIDDLVMVNGTVEVTELFLFDLFEFIWDKMALSRLERLQLLFECFDDFPLYTFAFQFDLIYTQLHFNERKVLCEWFENQLLRGGLYTKTIDYALGVGLFERGDVADEAWEFFVRKSTPPEILQYVLSMSGAVSYSLKKELYTSLLPDKSWHPYILKSLVVSLFWYGGLNKDDAKKVYEQLEIPAGFESEKATFSEGIEAYSEVPPPDRKPPSKKKKKSLKKKWDI